MKLSVVIVQFSVTVRQRIGDAFLFCGSCAAALPSKHTLLNHTAVPGLQQLTGALLPQTGGYE